MHLFRIYLQFRTASTKPNRITARNYSTSLRRHGVVCAMLCLLWKWSTCCLVAVFLLCDKSSGQWCRSCNVTADPPINKNQLATKSRASLYQPLKVMYLFHEISSFMSFKKSIQFNEFVDLAYWSRSETSYTNSQFFSKLLIFWLALGSSLVFYYAAIAHLLTSVDNPATPNRSCRWSILAEVCESWSL